MAKNKLRVIPLGGAAEVGRNMWVFEYDDDIIICDMGVMFPETEMMGVDLVLPDITYLRDKVANIRGVLLTMFDPRNNLANEVAAEVRKHFHVYDTIIPRNIRLAEAPSHGKPVVLYEAASKGAHGYLSLAREILEGSDAVHA